MKKINNHNCSVLRRFLTNANYPVDVQVYFAAVDSGYIDSAASLDPFQETSAILCASIAARQGGESCPENSFFLEDAIAKHSNAHSIWQVYLSMDQYDPGFIIALARACRVVINGRPQMRINVDQAYSDLMNWSDDSARRRWVNALAKPVSEIIDKKRKADS